MMAGWGVQHTSTVFCVLASAQKPVAIYPQLSSFPSHQSIIHLKQLIRHRQRSAWRQHFLSCQLGSTNVQMRRERGPDTPVWALWLVRPAAKREPKVMQQDRSRRGQMDSESHLTGMKCVFRQLVPPALVIWSQRMFLSAAEQTRKKMAFWLASKLTPL